MPRTTVRRISWALVVVMVTNLFAPCLALASEREFDTVLSGLPVLPEKANEPFPADLVNQVASWTLKIFFDMMAKPEMLDLSFVPMVPDATLNKKVNIRIRNVTKGEAFGLVLQLNDLKAVQFNERTVIIVSSKDSTRDFGLKTRKIYKLIYTAPKKVKDFISSNTSLSKIINKDNLIANDDNQSLLCIDTDRNIAMIDSVVALLDQKPNKIEAKIPLSFLTGTEFTSAVAALGTDVQQRVNTKSIYYSEKGRSLVVYDSPDNVEFIKALVKKVDLPAKQVLIDTSIMTVNSSFSRQMGIELKSTGFYIDSLDRLLNQNRLNAYLRGESGSGTVTGGTGSSASASVSGGTVQLTSAAQITYMLSKAGGQTLANPKIRTLDGERASITIGDIIVVRIISQTQQQAATGQSAVSQNVTPQEVTTGVQLSVKPTIHHDKTVTLELTVSNDTPTSIKDYGVDRSTTNSSSKLRVKDSETVILGGFINKKDSDDKTPVPFLGEVPILRSIFNKNQTSKQSSELVLLITPYILEYLINPNTGEAELPRIDGKDEDQKKERPQQLSELPDSSRSEKNRSFLRKPSGEPLVRNIYDNKGHVLLKHSLASSSGNTGAKETESLTAADREGTDPVQDVAVQKTAGNVVVDRGRPIATFRAGATAGGAEPRLASGSSEVGTLDRYEKAVAGASDWLKRSVESGERITWGNKPLPQGEEFKNKGKLSTEQKIATVPSPATLDRFSRAVRDSAEWKDGVVSARRQNQPDRMAEYGLMGRYKEKVADVQSWGAQVINMKTESPDPSVDPDEKPAPVVSSTKSGVPTGSPSPISAGRGRPDRAIDSFRNASIASGPEVQVPAVDRKGRLSTSAVRSNGTPGLGDGEPRANSTGPVSGRTSSDRVDASAASSGGNPVIEKLLASHRSRSIAIERPVVPSSFGSSAVPRSLGSTIVFANGASCAPIGTSVYGAASSATTNPDRAAGASVARRLRSLTCQLETGPILAPDPVGLPARVNPPQESASESVSPGDEVPLSEIKGTKRAVAWAKRRAGKPLGESSVLANLNSTVSTIEARSTGESLSARARPFQEAATGGSAVSRLVKEKGRSSIEPAERPASDLGQDSAHAAARRIQHLGSSRSDLKSRVEALTEQLSSDDEPSTAPANPRLAINVKRAQSVTKSRSPEKSRPSDDGAVKEPAPEVVTEERPASSRFFDRASFSSSTKRFALSSGKLAPQSESSRSADDQTHESPPESSTKRKTLSMEQSDRVADARRTLARLKRPSLGAGEAKEAKEDGDGQVDQKCATSQSRAEESVDLSGDLQGAMARLRAMARKRPAKSPLLADSRGSTWASSIAQADEAREERPARTSRARRTSEAAELSGTIDGQVTKRGQASPARSEESDSDGDDGEVVRAKPSLAPIVRSDRRGTSGDGENFEALVNDLDRKLGGI